MQKQVKIESISTNELKISAYDLITEMKQKSQILKLIEQELASRKAIKENNKMDETTNEEVVEAGGVHTTEEATETAE